MELVLQQNYVEIEQEEKMYLDGGFCGSLAWTFSSAVANAIIQGKGLEVDWRRAFGTIPYWVDINVK